METPKNLNKKRVLISGATGLLGKPITEAFQKENYEVAWLSRNKSAHHPPGVNLFFWEPALGNIDLAAIHWADVVVNLAGKSIGETPWTRKGKKEILESRIQSVETLIRALGHADKKLESFIGVSGAGIYGPGNSPKSELDLPGKGFPASVAAAWELAYKQLGRRHTANLCLLRLGIVLSTKGGALPKMMKPISWNLGAAIGSGNQGFNWIHIEDAARAFAEARHWNGVFNLSAPKQVNNRQAMHIIARAMGKKIWLPRVPTWVLEEFLGDRANLVTEGNYSDTSKIQEQGFHFRFPDLPLAMEDILKGEK
jgi:uncharacterized protein (TIGR01777 family)